MSEFIQQMLRVVVAIPAFSFSGICIVRIAFYLVTFLVLPLPFSLQEILSLQEIELVLPLPCPSKGL